MFDALQIISRSRPGVSVQMYWFPLVAGKLPDSQNLCASCRDTSNSPPLPQLLIVKYSNRPDGENVLNCCNSCFYCLVPNDECSGCRISPPKNRYKPPTPVVKISKFSTLVQAPRFICAVNLKSQIVRLNADAEV